MFGFFLKKACFAYWGHNFKCANVQPVLNLASFSLIFQNISVIKYYHKYSVICLILKEINITQTFKISISTDNTLWTLWGLFVWFFFFLFLANSIVGALLLLPGSGGIWLISLKRFSYITDSCHFLCSKIYFKNPQKHYHKLTMNLLTILLK